MVIQLQKLMQLFPYMAHYKCHTTVPPGLAASYTFVHSKNLMHKYSTANTCIFMYIYINKLFINLTFPVEKILYKSMDVNGNIEV